MERLLCDRDKIQVVHPNMEEAGGTKGNDGGSDIAAGDDLYPKNVRNRPSSASQNEK